MSNYIMIQEVETETWIVVLEASVEEIGLMRQITTNLIMSRSTA